mgnify:CR=1 FL=1
MSREENGNVCTHCSSPEFVVIETYKSYFLCECVRCKQVFILPRRATRKDAA